jgi:hypothetical protein
MSQVNKITDEEIKAIKTNSDNLEKAIAEADKALAARRISDLEGQNYVLSLFNKYGLRIGKDKIYFDGTIERVKVEETKPVSVEPAVDAKVVTEVEKDLSTKRVKKGAKNG